MSYYFTYWMARLQVPNVQPHGISMGIAYMGDKQELVVNNTADSSNMTRRNRARIQPLDRPGLRCKTWTQPDSDEHRYTTPS